MCGFVFFFCCCCYNSIVFESKSLIKTSIPCYFYYYSTFPKAAAVIKFIKNMTPSFYKEEDCYFQSRPELLSIQAARFYFCQTSYLFAASPAVFMCCLPSASDLDMCDLHGQKGGEVSDLGRQASRFLSPEAQKVWGSPWISYPGQDVSKCWQHTSAMVFVPDVRRGCPCSDLPCLSPQP